MKFKIGLSGILAIILTCAALMAAGGGQASPLSGTVSGITTYSGSYETEHMVLVSAHPDLNGEPIASVHTLGAGDYALENLPDGVYYISAFLDIHDRDEGPPEFGEPIGWYDANADGNPDPVEVSGADVSGIDIEIHDITTEYIQGTACYLGGVTGPGPLEVALHTNPADPPVTSLYLSLPCDEYIFSGGPTGTYYISLLYDVNDSSGPPDPGEPTGWYDANGDGNPDPVIYTGEVIRDLDITLGGIHHVDFSASGDDDGTSWENAFHDLQDALAIAQPGEEIWVAAGQYHPGITRESSFVLPHGVAVYGGFSGAEEYRNQRNVGANLTVLSGEIGDPASKTDNTFHVVTTASTYEIPVDSSTILDGFTITGGYANVIGADREKGGGILSSYGTPTLVNLNFVGNYALNHGGALAVQYNLTPVVVANCIFSGNQATNNAGGLANLAQVIVLNSVFTGNSGANGGGIVNLDGSLAEIHNSILWGNPGGQIALQGNAQVTATYSVVEGGFASGSHILNADPLFADADGLDNIAGTWDDDLRLQAGSPALDAGDNTRLPADVADSNGNGNTGEPLPLDFEGDARTLDDPTAVDSGNGSAPLVDMGADERSDLVGISGLLIATAPHSPLVGETVQFAARALTGTQVSYTWEFGDGNTGAGALPTHTYTNPGEYTVTLTTSNSLDSQQTSQLVKVKEALVIDPGSSETTSDGVLTFSLPTTLTGSVTITYLPREAPNPTPGGFEFAGLVFELQAFDEADNPIREPEDAFTLTIHYTEGVLPAGTDEATLQLSRYDEITGDWLALPVLMRDLENDTLTVSLEHFSQFALLVEAAETSGQVYLPLVKR